ncbi:Tn3 family transposase [Streptomyces sp. NPDC047453]|uniref:Tn3 family transposase n=1 Tax=Streptomyces sp. NPDC047453 TaxID=3154812 RepID=UPI0033DDF7A4
MVPGAFAGPWTPLPPALLDANPYRRGAHRARREAPGLWLGPRLQGEVGVTSVSDGGCSLSVEVLAQLLLLVIYAAGTNTGIKAVVSSGHGHTEDELCYVRRRYLSAEVARAIAIQIANASFGVRSTEFWGQGSIAVASDSTCVPTTRTCSPNGTRATAAVGCSSTGIYWHVEKKSVARESLGSRGMDHVRPPLIAKGGIGGRVPDPVGGDGVSGRLGAVSLGTTAGEDALEHWGSGAVAPRRGGE